MDAPSTMRRLARCGASSGPGRSPLMQQSKARCWARLCAPPCTSAATADHLDAAASPPGSAQPQPKAAALRWAAAQPRALPAQGKGTNTCFERHRGCALLPPLPPPPAATRLPPDLRPFAPAPRPAADRPSSLQRLVSLAVNATLMAAEQPSTSGGGEAPQPRMPQPHRCNARVEDFVQASCWGCCTAVSGIFGGAGVLRRCLPAAHACSCAGVVVCCTPLPLLPLKLLAWR